MAGVPTRLVNDFLFYGFLLGAGVLFLLGSSIFIPALRPASGGSSSSNSGLQSIQDQLNRLSSQVSSAAGSKGIPIKWVVPSAASYKPPAAPKQTNTASNCTNASGFTIWKGNGCLKGKQVYNVAAEVKGTGQCAAARAEFLRRYKC